MFIRRISLASVTALMLLTCSSCRLANLDQNDDGVITRDEIIAAIQDAVCGNSEEPTTGTDDGSTDDGSTDDGSTDGGQTDDGQTDDGSTAQ